MVSNVVTARISDDTLERIDRLAKDFDRSRAWVIAHLLDEGAKRETDFADFLKEGEDAFDRGDYITHDQLIANIERKYGRKQAA